MIAQVSCDMQQPKLSRPNEGMIHINVELTPLAAQHFESGRQSEAAILISRQLEKCFKDSKCVDLESLCIVADKKVSGIFDIFKYCIIMCCVYDNFHIRRMFSKTNFRGKLRSKT